VNEDPELNAYVERKAREFAATLPDWALEQGMEERARGLVRDVMRDMAIRLAHPQGER
jgi:hypothetical protein